MQALGSMNSLPAAMLISATNVSERISIPVPPSQVIYSYFEHVAGVASSGGASASIDKLQILNTLIDRLLSMKQDPLAALQMDSSKPSPERIDALIEQYGKEAHALASRTGPYLSGGLGLAPGSLISLAA